jgi:soluble lytic murein transglycosylase-like protein
MNDNQKLLLLLGGVVAYLYYQQSQTPATAADSAVSFTNDPLSSIGDAIVSSTVGWKNAGDGPQWIDALNQAEVANGIPPDLLARLAYQESHFRHDVITGVTPSPAGALGLMQMMPQFFASVRVPRPYTATDTQNQIYEAAQTLAGHYAEFHDWSLALAAYNAGAGAVKKAGGIPAFTETINYVNQILADVPGLV